MACPSPPPPGSRVNASVQVPYEALRMPGNLRRFRFLDLNPHLDSFLGTLGGRLEEISKIWVVWGEAVVVSRYHFSPHQPNLRLCPPACDFLRFGLPIGSGWTVPRRLEPASASQKGRDAPGLCAIEAALGEQRCGPRPGTPSWYPFRAGSCATPLPRPFRRRRQAPTAEGDREERHQRPRRDISGHP